MAFTALLETAAAQTRWTRETNFLTIAGGGTRQGGAGTWLNLLLARGAMRRDSPRQGVRNRGRLAVSGIAASQREKRASSTDESRPEQLPPDLKRWVSPNGSKSDSAVSPVTEAGTYGQAVVDPAKAARIWTLHEAAPGITLAEVRAALAAEGI